MNPNLSAADQALKILSALHYKGRPKSLSKAKQQDRRATLNWGWHSHVRGIGLGYKRTESKIDFNVPCLTVYVRRKLPKSRIPSKGLVPERLSLASLGYEVQTDVIEIAHPIVAHKATNIQPGVDVGHVFGERGTLGLLVRRAGQGGVFAISCSHVLARSGVSAAPGDLVEHPPLFGVDPEQNEFGTLTSEFTKLNTSQTFEEDFALAVINVPPIAQFATNDVTVDAVFDANQGFQPGIGTSLHGILSPAAAGQILNPSFSGDVHDIPFVGTVSYESLVPYQSACAPGDSGGAVLQLGTSTILGLHVGGSSEDEFGVFMPVSRKFAQLGLTPFG